MPAIVKAQKASERLCDAKSDCSTDSTVRTGLLLLLDLATVNDSALDILRGDHANFLHIVSVHLQDLNLPLVDPAVHPMRVKDVVSSALRQHHVPEMDVVIHHALKRLQDVPRSQLHVAFLLFIEWKGVVLLVGTIGILVDAQLESIDEAQSQIFGKFLPRNID